MGSESACLPAGRVVEGGDEGEENLVKISLAEVVQGEPTRKVISNK